MLNAQAEFEKWLSGEFLDITSRNELERIINDENEINERFYKNLEFGTAGLRGIIGCGTNRMNVYTVRKATQGLAEYIKALGEKAMERGVVIAYDSRLYSDLFAKETALVLCANNIKAYLFDELKPVPMLSFAVRHLNCAMGVMITASHNPAKYNGYKVYGEDGAQIAPEVAEKVFKAIDSLDIFEDVKTANEIDAVSCGLLEMIGSKVEKVYLENVFAQSINKDLLDKTDIKIVYTPFHGTGNIPIRKILKMRGLENIYVVPEQEKPDPAFSTVTSPNPENPEGFFYAVNLANEVGSDIIIGTDPDCDRVGVMAKAPNGKFVPLNGNQMGALLTHYIITERNKNNTLPQKPIAVKTIVSTELAQKICDKYNVEMRNVLTGFKFIGEIIKDLEEKGEAERYIFGFEESYGCLCGSYARDKDGVVATMLICEMAAFYKEKNMTLYDAVQKLYEEFGYFRESQKALTLEGISGLKKIKNMMSFIKENPFTEMNGQKVVALTDISKGEKLDLISGKTEKINLPESDVLIFELEDETKFIVRPSGTEPKIKFYFFVCGETAKAADELMNSLSGAVLEQIDKLM